MKKLLLILGVCLVAFSNCKKDDEEATPKASFSPSLTCVSINETIYFTNQSKDADHYHWDFGDGKTSSENSPSHSYSSAGNYTVTLTAYSKSEGKKDTFTSSINVKGVGDIMFWTDESTIYSITVKLNGLSKIITSYYYYTPSCGSSGCATFYDLAEGTYSYSAENLLYTWSGTVTVEDGVCSRWLLYSGKAEKKANPDGQSVEKLTLGLDLDEE